MLRLPLSIAPMIDWTYTHFRVLMRILAPQVLLYTEMQTPQAIANHPQRCLYFSAMEHPLALQLGGSDPDGLVTAAQQAQDVGYVEINLNLGCPSDRVLSGHFGACLMNEPHQVASIIRTLKQHTHLPITAKTRIGIDHQDSYSFFSNFIHRLADAGCDKFIIHARKAWLKGLSPKQNRTIPPVNYDYVYQIKTELPHLPFVINGNIGTLEAVLEHLNQVDGVMLGRLACDNPYAVAQIHHGIYPDCPLKSRHQIAQEYFNYLQTVSHTPLTILLKPLLNLAHGLPKAKTWKNHLITMQRTHTVPDNLESIFEILT
ncbi:MAG: tRNA dihydrouridine(20/20a) synthase DusA [Legionellaceae bacterium]|nr:tRNA dihydrouridine(20/20a) synthase DusA [Legionellaceae bacterium]MBP9776052.1 tRNA dihydrouridine(20/20a) synthase DusA [Legionellaceae bacterium]